MTAAIMAAVVASDALAQGAAYTPAMLACASFREVMEADLTVESGGRTGSATSGREGVLLVAGRPGEGAMTRIAAWYDSLRIWRAAAGPRSEPDPSGMLGGQFRGDLAPDGRLSINARPFVPDEVLAVMDMGSALDDFLPRLAPRMLQVGEEWRLGDSIAIQRLADSAALQRFRVRIARTGPVHPAPGDTITPTYTRNLSDIGVAAWDPVRGPVRYDHRVEAVADVPAEGGVDRPVRSQLRQHVVLERLAADCAP